MDIGTNTVQMLIADVAGGVVVRRHQAAIVTRLGRGVDAGGMLDPEAVTATVAALATHRAAAADMGAVRVAAVATSAVRDAADRDGFLESAQDAIGVRPELIDGRREARLTFAGVRSGLRGRDPVLVIDPGGGSTEFVLGSREPDYAVSIDIGSVRLTERLLAEKPASAPSLRAACEHVDGLLGSVELPYPAATIVGVGGTFTSLAAILLDLAEYDPATVHGSRFDVSAFRAVRGRLADMTLAETRAIPSLDPDRAPVLLGGAVVVERSLAKAGAASVVVSEADILDGLALELARER